MFSLPRLRLLLVTTRKIGTEAKGKGAGNGPGGHRARETRKQAETAKWEEKLGGGEEGRGGVEAMAVCLDFATDLANPSRVLLPALWPPVSSSQLLSAGAAASICVAAVCGSC